MGAGAMEDLMDRLGYPKQGSKKANKDYINARR
jgi:hypothetical protein